MNKHLLSDIKIQKIGYNGIGISTLENGKKVLIKGGAFPGSIVDCRIVKRRKDFIEAHIIEVKKYDPAYADGEIFCPHYFVPMWASATNQNSHKIGCGGCKRQIMSYTKQLELKQSIAIESFKNQADIQILPIIPSPIFRGYRNKIEFSFGKYISDRYSIDANRNLGFHKQGEFSKIVDIDSCGLITPKANQIYEYIKELCKKSWLPVHDQKVHQGFRRHLILREGINTGQILVNLSISEGYLSDETRSIREERKQSLLTDDFLQKSVNTFVITYNNSLADIVKSDQSSTQTLRGEGYMYEKLIFPSENQEAKLEINFRISPFSFFQTNTLAAQELFYHAAKAASNVKGTVLDLYCGAGSIGLSFAKLGIGNKIIGIEVVEQAITDARHNAKINGLENSVNFLAGKVENLHKDYPDIDKQFQDLELIVVDPPREWLHKNVITFLTEIRKKYKAKLIYISCNPITMSRDISLLHQAGYKTQYLQPVDMFPHTHHIEVIWLLY